VKVKLNRYTDDKGVTTVAQCPSRAHSTDAGLDLYAMHGGLVRAHQAATFHTGVHVELPRGTAGVMLPKSGLMVNRDILTFGVIDESYRGEILVHAFNLSNDDYTVRAGDKLTQMLIIPVLYEQVEVVDELSYGERGVNGFGSSGR
jgi:dUTP pyrophosphatase